MPIIELLHAFGFNLNAIAENIKYKGDKGISVPRLKSWLKDKTSLKNEDVLAKYKAVTNAILAVMTQQHRPTAQQALRRDEKIYRKGKANKHDK